MEKLQEVLGVLQAQPIGLGWGESQWAAVAAESAGVGEEPCADGSWGGRVKLVESKLLDHVVRFRIF